MTVRFDWHRLGDQVTAKMAWARDRYRAHAWGKDEIRPVTGTVASFA